jgi:hypothetical protein
MGIPIRDDVMNLNSIITSTRNAQMTVAFKCGTSRRLPIFAIWCRLSSAPEMAFLSCVSRRQQFRSAFIAATHFRSALAAFPFELANLAFSYFSVRASPPRTEVTGSAAKIAGGRGCRLIEGLSALGAVFGSSVASGVRADALLALVPRLPFVFRPANVRAITTTGTSDEMRMTFRAMFVKALHSVIVPLKPSYFEQACRNMEQAKREQGGLFAEMA